MFKEKFCYQCKHDNYPDSPMCEILANSMAFNIGDEQYPDEWTYDEDGKPTCTAFEQG